MPRVHLINPKARKRRKKATAKRKTTTPARKKTTVAKKRTTRRRRAPVAAPKRRRARRKTNPSPARRANPRRKSRRGGGGLKLFGGGIMKEAKAWGPTFIGKLWTAWVVRRVNAMGGGGQLFQAMPGGATLNSPMSGTSWGWPQYIAAVFAVQIGAKVFSKVGVPEAGFRQGGWDLILTKLVWTEGFARVPWAQQAFGNVPRYQPSTGQTWLGQGNQMVAMQGAELVSAGPLDGQLVEAGPLDGELVSAGPLDGHRRRGRRRMSSSYGHRRTSSDPFVSQYAR